MIPLAPYSERFKGRKPRIFVGLVSFGDVPADILHSWVMWGVYNGKKYADKFELYFGIAKRKEQYRARNNLVRDAQEAGADFLLTIDDDQTVFDCPDMLEKFFSLEKPVQCALAMQRGNSPFATVMKTYPDGTVDFVPLDEIPLEPHPVEFSGGGCTWTDMLVFDFLEEPHWWPYPMEPQATWFKPDTRLGLDLHFCQRVRANGLEVWLNTGVTVGHMETERPIARVPDRGPKGCPRCGTMLVDGECRVPICGSLKCRECLTPMMNGACPKEDCALFGKTHLAPNNRMDTDAYLARERFRPAYKQVGKAICDVFPFSTVLDIGSGQGFLVDALLSEGKDVRGVELEPAAQGFMSVHALPRIQIGDATNGGCPRGRFDLVTCVEVAEHVPEEKTAALLDNIADKASEYVYFTADQTPSIFHINLKPKGFWIEEFRKRGFALDLDKTRAMEDALVGNPCPWIRQNSLAFKRIYPEVRESA